jgi:recombinase-like zinc beta ribbon protein
MAAAWWLDRESGRGRPDDPYVLRSLLVCEMCRVPMLPVQTPSGVRQYRCPTGACERPVMAAEAVENAVWQHVAWCSDELADVAVERRREVLGRLLKRVRVGEEPREFWLEWGSE